MIMIAPWTPTVAYDARLTLLHRMTGHNPDIVDALRAADVYAWAPMMAATIRGATRDLPLNSLTLTADLFPTPSFWYMDMPVLDPEETVIAQRARPGFVPPTSHSIYPLLFWRVRDPGDALRLAWFNEHLHWPFFVIDVPLDVPITHMFEKTPAVPNDQEWAWTRIPTVDDLRGLYHVMVATVVAGTFFLRQRILDAAPVAVDRHARKRAARLDLAVEPRVRVVQLRRIYHDAPASDDHAALHQWSCRWFVSGHWRRLQPPARPARLVWVMPHLKGPADAPLKLPGARIFSVTR